MKPPDNCAVCPHRRLAPMLFDRALRQCCGLQPGAPFLDNDWQNAIPAWCPIPAQIIAAVER